MTEIKQERVKYSDLPFKQALKVAVKQGLIIGGIFLILLITVTSALAFNLTDGLVAYWDMEEGSGTYLASRTGSYGLTMYGGVNISFSNPFLGNYSLYATGTSNLIGACNATGWGHAGFDDGYAYSIWVNGTATDNNFIVNTNYFNLRTIANGSLVKFRGGDYDGTLAPEIGTNSVSAGVFHHVVTNYNGTSNKFQMWLNGVFQGEGALNSVSATSRDNCLMNWRGQAYSFLGQLDEVAVYNRHLDGEEILALYNGGVGLAYPFDTSVPSDLLNVSFTASDIYNSQSLGNFTVLLSNGTSYTTTAGTQIIELNKTLNYNFSLINSFNHEGYYFNRSYENQDVTSGTFNAELTQALVTLTATELITGNVLTGTFKINGSTLSFPSALSAGTYNFSFTNSSYYQKDSVQNVTALFNGTKTITGVYPVLFNISFKNAYSQVAVNTFSGWIYNNETGYNETFTTTTGLAQVGAIPGNWTVYAETDAYSIGSDNYQNFEVNSTITSHNFTFLIYSNNSVLFTVWDEELGISLSGTNVSITLTGEDNETTYYTSNASLFLENLKDGSYTVKAVDMTGNFTVKTYSLTVADRSTQTLAIYLTRAGQLVTFNILDFDSGISLEGAGMTMYRLINSSWIIVESKSSDVTGRAQFSYTPYVKYKFVISLTNYNTKVFYLDPVLFTSYNIRLEKTTTLSDVADYVGVSVVFYPKEFFVNDSNTFTWSIQSSNGTLTNYNLTLIYPGGSFNDSGVNAVGEEFTHVFNISVANFSDIVNVTYCYVSTISTSKCFTYIYGVYGAYEEESFLGNRNKTYGLGLFERILISTLAVIVIAGFFSMFLGFVPGGVIGLFLFGYFNVMGFVPLWSILPSILVGVVLIVMRGQQ